MFYKLIISSLFFAVDPQENLELGLDAADDGGFREMIANPAFNAETCTICFVWAVGPTCELSKMEQLEILDQAVYYLTKPWPAIQPSLYTFSRVRESLVYQDNPVYSIV
jgi:hypothetical protein